MQSMIWYMFNMTSKVVDQCACLVKRSEEGALGRARDDDGFFL